MTVVHTDGLCECGCGNPAPIARQTERKYGHVKGQPMRFIFGHHLRRRWKGRRLSSGGYVLIYLPTHPRATSSGSVFEHILVAESAVGKALPEGAVVHHVNDRKDDNVPSNLCLLQNNVEHLELHRRRRVLRAGGRPFADWICSRCKGVKPWTSFRRRSDGRIDATCIPCDTARRTAAKRRSRGAA